MLSQSNIHLEMNNPVLEECKNNPQVLGNTNLGKSLLSSWYHMLLVVGE